MTLPLENLDDLTFDDLMRDAISRIPVYAPSWTDHNKSDPGITFIELFAWIVETQIYRLNRISDRSYLKFFDLMGIDGPRSARPARLDVTFSITGDRIDLKAGTHVAASKNDIMFRTEEDLSVLDLSMSKIIASDGKKISLIDVDAGFSGLNYVIAFLDKESSLYLGLKGNSNCNYENQIISLAFYLFDAPDAPESDGSQSETSGFLTWASLSDLDSAGMGIWTEMAKSVDETCDLCYSGKMKLKFMKNPACAKDPPKDIMPESTSPEIANAMANLHWIRCKAKEDAKEIFDSPPRIECVLANTVSAQEGERYCLKEKKTTAQPKMTLILEHAPVYEISPPPDQKIPIPDQESSKLKGPGSNRFIIKPASESGDIWMQAKDLDSSGPHDRHFLLDAENGIITFGDGINGAVPPKDGDILLNYVSGAGSRGNVPEGAIDRIIPGPDASRRLSSLIAEKILKAENRSAAKGGHAGESLDEAKSRARRSLKVVNRAVTVSDYEDLAYRTPGFIVARAKAIPCYHPVCGSGVRNAVTVIAIPASSRPLPIPSKKFLKAVFDHLDRHRLLTTRLFVYPPVYVKIEIATAKVVARNRWDATKVLEEVCKNLFDFLSPLSGGPNGAGWPFGRQVYLSEIYKTVAGTEGVDFVYDISLNGTIIDGAAQQIIVPDDRGDIVIPEYGLVYTDLDIGGKIEILTGDGYQHQKEAV
jgi:hypothetical protein